jgi:hypothetical protein
MFDAEDWIKQNVPGGDTLLPEAYNTVASLTVLWNYFEAAFCNSSASPHCLSRLADWPGSVPLSGELVACLDYWKNRYVTSAGTNSVFDGLNFRRGDQGARVKDVLLGNELDPKSQFFALLMIVYRLRNNLFHGLKTVDMLNSQVENLTAACSALAAGMERLP